MSCSKEDCDKETVDKWSLCECHMAIYEAKFDTVKAIAKFIKDGGGSYRQCLYDYIGEDDYSGFLDAGLMDITNFVFRAYENLEGSKE